MKDQIVLSPKNGEVVLAMPLFRLVQDDAIISRGHFTIAFNTSDPMAWVLEHPQVGLQIVSNDWATKHLEFLGDL